MQINTLTVTRDQNGRPNRGVTMSYSTNERLIGVLNRSIIFSYVDSIYNNSSSLFVNEIRDDILHELKSITNSDFRAEGSHQYVYAESTPDITDRLADVLGLCRFLVGESTSFPQDSMSLVDLPTFGGYRQFFRAVVQFAIATRQIQVEIAPEPFTINEMTMPVIARHGFTLYLHMNRHFVSTYEFNPTKLANGGSGSKLTDFLQCVFIPNATIDTYMTLVAAACYEPDMNMFDTKRRNFNDIRYMQWIRSVYGNDGIGRVIRDVAHGKDLITDGSASSAMMGFLKTVVTLYDRFRLSLGPCTSKVLNLCVSSGILSESNLHVANYIRGVLTDPNAEENTTADSAKQYAASNEFYVPSLDINSPLFIAVEAVEDETLTEDDEDEDVDADLVDDETAETSDDDEEEEVTPDEDDEGDDEDDPAPEPDEEPVQPEADSSDKSGFTLTLPTDPKSLDAYLYLIEVEFLITELLENPPEDMSVEDLAVLKDLKAHWLFLLSLESVHEIVTDIVKLPIKITKAA